MHKDHCAIVTGAADGIGRATTKLLRAQGARVLAVDRNPEGLDSEHLTCDLTDADATTQILEEAHKQIGNVDYLVNNAGIAAGMPIESMSDELWRDVMAINVDAVFRLSRAFIPDLKRSKRGRIINIGSIRSTFAGRGHAAYAASKHALAGLTKTLAVELGRDGITANYIQPGAIVTGITRKAFSERDGFREYWEGKAATGRLGQPEDVAHAINFLLSEEASFISGIGLPVDGGAMAEM